MNALVVICYYTHINSPYGTHNLRIFVDRNVLFNKDKCIIVVNFLLGDLFLLHLWKEYSVSALVGVSLLVTNMGDTLS